MARIRNRYDHVPDDEYDDFIDGMSSSARGRVLEGRAKPPSRIFQFRLFWRLVWLIGHFWMWISTGILGYLFVTMANKHLKE